LNFEVQNTETIPTRRSTPSSLAPCYPLTPGHDVKLHHTVVLSRAGARTVKERAGGLDGIKGLDLTTGGLSTTEFLDLSSHTDRKADITILRNATVTISAHFGSLLQNSTLEYLI
jgi:hypothetical protein